MLRWWNQHRSTPLSVWVAPPSASGVTWWISHQAAGMLQPGMMQPPSRRLIALRWDGVKQRCGEPSSMTRPSESKRMFWVPPVQMNCLTESKEIGSSTPSQCLIGAVADAATTGEVVGGDADQHGGGRSPDRRGFAAACSDVDHAGKHVVALLRVGSRIAPALGLSSFGGGPLVIAQEGAGRLG